MANKAIKTIISCCLLSVATTKVTANQTCTALTATGGPNYAPATWLKDDKIIGYMPDLIRDIGKKLGIPTTVVQGGGWKRVLANVEAGQFDIVMGLLKNDERLTKFDYMTAVTEEPIVIASHTNNIAPYNGTWQSLEGLQGGVILGVSFGSKLNQFIRDNLSVRITPDYPGLFRQLNRGRLDYVIASEFALKVNASDADTL
ncbi:MAG: substrate-binding periplasmic protein, partial [Kordiimonas sp.]